MILIVLGFQGDQPMIGWWLVSVVYCRNPPMKGIIGHVALEESHDQRLPRHFDHPFTVPCHQLLQASAKPKEVNKRHDHKMLQGSSRP